MGNVGKIPVPGFFSGKEPLRPDETTAAALPSSSGNTPPTGRVDAAVENLTPTQLKDLMGRVSASERRRILKPGVNVPKKEDKILQKVSDSRQASVELTRTSDHRSRAAKIKQAILNHTMTANQAYLMMRKSRRAKLDAAEGDANSLPLASGKNIAHLLSEARKSAGADSKLDLAAMLAGAGYATKISDLNLSDNNLLKGVSLTGLSFSGCTFDWSHLSNATISHCKFQDCDFLNTSFENSKLEHCEFTDCILREAMLVNTQLQHVKFEKCDLISSSFEDANMSHVQFENVMMPGTHFLQAAVIDAAIRNSNLKDAVFFGDLHHFDVDSASAETAVLTRPATAMPVFTEARGISVPKVYMKLDQAAHTIPLRIAMQDQSVSKEGVNTEVASMLLHIGDYDPQKPPIAKQLLDAIKENPDDNPDIAKIIAKAKKLAAHVDAICLPGGEDVPPALYGAQQDKKTDWGGDYRRSMTELALIDEAINKNMPFMGVCRGFQMANVFFGAQMTQHLEGHSGIQRFSLANKEQQGLYGEAMQHSILSTVYHHQAIGQQQGPTDYLEPAIIYQNLIKASEPKRNGAAPAVLLQFHPEFYKAKSAGNMREEAVDFVMNAFMSQSNDDFWNILSDGANAYRNKKMAMAQLKEMKEVNEAVAPTHAEVPQEIGGTSTPTVGRVRHDNFVDDLTITPIRDTGLR